ncbi:MAG: 3'-5' exonuclease, partial [Tomitella sp.]|nr:3'-5' exonuclease [Tomitella sp.]
FADWPDAAALAGAEEAAVSQWDAAKNAGDIPAMASAHDQLQDAYYDRLLAARALHDYDDITAQYAAATAETPPDVWRENTIGTAELVTNAEPGSQAWAQARQSGIRGDHVGALAGCTDDTSPHTVSSAKHDTLDPADDTRLEQLRRQNSTHTGRAGRAAAYEQAVLADINSEALVDDTTDRFHTAPGVWRNRDRPWQTCEVSGITVGDDNTPTGVVLSRTVDRNLTPTDGLPPHLHAEALNACDTTGLATAHVYAIPEGELNPTRYTVHADEPLSGAKTPLTMPDARDTLESRWGAWQDEKANPAEQKRNAGTFTWVKSPKSETGHAKNAATANTLAAYRGLSRQQAHDMITTEIAGGATPDDAVRSLYRSYNPTQDPRRQYVVFDVETNSLSPGRGEIIQTGAVVMNGRGEVTERLDSLHGIDPRAARTINTGAVDVHGIDYAQVHGRPRFRDSAAHKRLHTLLADQDTTLVAHNASFEAQYLAAHGIAAPRIVDTMHLSRKFDHDSTGAKLADFTAAHGVDYADAHNAYRDADMTARALLGFWRDQHTPVSGHRV